MFNTEKSLDSSLTGSICTVRHHHKSRQVSGNIRKTRQCVTRGQHLTFLYSHPGTQKIGRLLKTDEEARVRNSRRHVKTLQHTVHIYMKNSRQSQQYLCCAILECLWEEISAVWLCCLLMINRPEGRPDCPESSQWNLFSDQKLLSEKSTVFKWSVVWTENQESIWIQSAFDIHVTCNRKLCRMGSDWLKKHLIPQVNYFFLVFPLVSCLQAKIQTCIHTPTHT